MGEEKEKEEKKKEGNEKKEEGPRTVVIKVDMHCEGCARKVKKAVKDFPGVHEAKADIESNKLTVVGKVDPKDLCERLKKKVQKKVELISPQPKKDGGDEKKKQQSEEKDKDKENKKPKEPPVVTTVLKVFLHCEGCAQTVQKAILKMDGVQSAEPDTKNHKFTVKGTMDPNKLANYLHRKTRKHVEIVPQKKEGDKKDGKKDGDSSAEKKDGDSKKAAGGGDNKKSGEQESSKESSGGGDDSEKGSESKKNEAPPPFYIIEQVHAPQIFSDENPNACSVM